MAAARRSTARAISSSPALGVEREVDPVELLRDGRLADAESFRAFMTLAKLEKPLADNLYSFAASRTERLPHQFKAVLKLLANPYGRLLIADEVGLGKTIEAGIILTELNARGPLDHVLVACPSPLTQKWRREMRDRFLFDFEVLDGQGFREFVTADRGGPSPEPRRVIASLELMRRAENLEALGTAAPSLDVVIVDEAHHMRNLGTATNELGEVLTGLAETVVFLTATPLNLGRDDFFQLMRLLVPEEFPQLDTFTALIEPNEHINLALRHLRATLAAGLRRRARRADGRRAHAQSAGASRAARATSARAQCSSAARAARRSTARTSCAASATYRAQHALARVHAHAQARGSGALPDAPLGDRRRRPSLTTSATSTTRSRTGRSRPTRSAPRTLWPRRSSASPRAACPRSGAG